MHYRSVRFLLTGLFVVGLLTGALATPHADQQDESDTSYGSTPQTRIAPPLPDRPDPGFDVEGGPISEGEELRRLTRLTEAEVAARDPEFRRWVELIRSGLADKRVMRLYWFFRSRLDPFDTAIPENWRQAGVELLRDEQRTRNAIALFTAARRDRAEALQGEQETPPEGSVFAARDRMRNTDPQGTTLPPGISTNGVWVPIGPFNIPGRMTGLDRPAGRTDTLYAIAADGGVWRTTDGAQTWKALTDFEPTLSGGAILLDPSNPDIIYFGTGEGNGAIDNYPGIGVLKSTDGGKTWSASNNFSSAVRSLAMHASEPSRIYAAGDEGCYVSDDAGATFNLMGGGLTQAPRGHTVQIRADDPDVVFCTIQGTGIFRSTDHAVNWTRLDNGLPPEGTGGRIVLAISQSNPEVLIAGYDQGGGTVYRTDDGGDTWAEVPGNGLEDGYCFSQCWYDNVVSIDPVDPDILYVGGVNAYRSLDGGANWTQMSSSAGGRGAPNYVHVDQHFIFAPAGGEVFLANDGGIYRSTDNGSNWIEWSQGMDTTQYYGICRHPSDDGWAFGGTQDNGSHRRREGQDPEWQRVLGGDGGMCMSGPDGSNIIVGEYQNHNMRRSINDGDTWSNANGGIGSGEPRPWVGLLEADPADRNNMWTTTDRVYRSLDARSTAWVAVSEGLFSGATASTIAVSPVVSDVVYVGFTGGGLAASPDGLAALPNWKKNNQTDLPTRTVRRIRAHPDEALTAYAVFSGFGDRRIYKTTDRGVTWIDHTGDLPNVPVNDILIDGDNPGTLIIATDLGVYRSDDDGATWYGFSSGLPTVASIEFTYDRTSGRLRLGTHGRSMWEWQPSSATPVAVPDGATVPGAPLTVERLGATDMRVRWDVGACTAWEYTLLYGDLDDVANRAYSGAECDIGTSGQTDVPLPSTPSGDAFFVVVGIDEQGTEGPHGFDVLGDPINATGIGFCGIAAQDALATCP